jgi:hypothetical protein
LLNEDSVFFKRHNLKFKVSGKPTIGSISGGHLFDVASDLCELSFMETLLLTKYHP